MSSQPEQQIITIQVLPNISRSKGNQEIKFGQLIEYNVRNIFLQKSRRSWDKESSPILIFVFSKASYKAGITLSILIEINSLYGITNWNMCRLYTFQLTDDIFYHVFPFMPNTILSFSFSISWKIWTCLNFSINGNHFSIC